jgi:hypothetical protein
MMIEIQNVKPATKHGFDAKKCEVVDGRKTIRGVNHA